MLAGEGCLGCLCSNGALSERCFFSAAAPAPPSGNQPPLLTIKGAFLIHFPSVKALAAQGAAFALFLALRFPGRAAGEAQHLTHS